MLDLDLLISFLRPSVIAVDGNKVGYFYIVDFSSQKTWKLAKDITKAK